MKNKIAALSNVYRDRTFLITKHALTVDSLVHFTNPDGPNVLNTEQAQFIIVRAGKLTVCDLDGNIVHTQIAGDTTDTNTSTFIIPDAGILSFDAGTEMYCVMKIGLNTIVRETLDLQQSVTGKEGVLCVMDGNVSVNANTIDVPGFMKINASDTISAFGPAWAILVS